MKMWINFDLKYYIRSGTLFSVFLSKSVFTPSKFIVLMSIQYRMLRLTYIYYHYNFTLLAYSENGKKLNCSKNIILYNEIIAASLCSLWNNDLMNWKFSLTPRVSDYAYTLQQSLYQPFRFLGRGGKSCNSSQQSVWLNLEWYPIKIMLINNNVSMKSRYTILQRYVMKITCFRLIELSADPEGQLRVNIDRESDLWERFIWST